MAYKESSNHGRIHEVRTCAICVHAANEFHIFVVPHYFTINYVDPWLRLSSDENRVDLPWCSINSARQVQTNLRLWNS